MRAFLFFFGDKNSFQKVLYLHPSITEFKMGEEIRTKAVVDVSRGAGGRIFL